MKLFFAAFLTAIFAAGCTHEAVEPTSASISPDTKLCSSQTTIGERCAIAPTKVHPTQFALGLKDVVKKRKKIANSKFNTMELTAYLTKNTPPAVKGPKNIFYIVDGHHRTRAMAEESLTYIYIEVKKDYSTMSQTDFWNQMKKDNYVWLYNEKGEGPIDPAKIPASIAMLPDDPYRSLAEDALEHGGFSSTDTLYQQFMWANYFRPLIPLDKVLNNYDEAVKDAVEFAHDAAAQDLPGYKKKAG